MCVCVCVCVCVCFYLNFAFFQIIIKAVRGSSYTSDIAVDDVSFAPECLQTEGRLSYSK